MVGIVGSVQHVDTLGVGRLALPLWTCVEPEPVHHGPLRVAVQDGEVVGEPFLSWKGPPRVADPYDLCVMVPPLGEERAYVLKALEFTADVFALVSLSAAIQELPGVARASLHLFPLENARYPVLLGAPRHREAAVWAHWCANREMSVLGGRWGSLPRPWDGGPRGPSGRG